MQDLNDKVTSGTLTAVEWNEVPSEIQNVIEALGQALSSGDLNQLGKGIAGYVANGVFYTDSGIADAYVLAKIGSKQAPTAYTDGFKVSFLAGNTNTGASTVNIAGLGIKSIKTSTGGNPVAGDIFDRIDLIFDASNDWFEVLNPFFSRPPFALDTLADAVANTSLYDGATIILSGRNSKGDGGGATWGAVLSSSVTENPYDIIQCVGVGTLSIVLRTNGFFVASQNGATHDSSDSAAVLNYIMTKSNYVIDGAYSVATPLSVQNTTKGEMRGATITALTDSFDVLTATTKSAFEMTGNLKVVGAGKAGTGKGVNFFDCFDYKMDCDIDVSEFEDGIFCDGTTIATGGLSDHRGRQGRWTNPTAHNNQNGIKTLRRAEYMLFSNPQVTQNTAVGWTNSAGNTNVIGGNIQDNQNGVLLIETGTTNANHGMFASVNINHNIGYNLRTEDVEYGHTFNGCHIYGDSASAGTIELIRSNGINITDGIIDAKITIDGGVTPTSTIAGWNRISGNQMDETFTVFDSSNNGREQTIVTDNFQRNGDAWGLNDRAFVEARATAETSTQTLTSNATTVILFPTQKSDNRGFYDDTTGVLTTDQDVNLQVEFNFQVSISGGTFVDGFVGVYVNGVVQALSGLIAFNAANTSLGSNGHLTLALQASDTVDIRANVEATAGTITVGADIATNVSFVSSN